MESSKVLWQPTLIPQNVKLMRDALKMNHV